MTDEISHRARSAQPAVTAAPRILLTDTTGFPGAAQLAINLAKAGCDVSAVYPISHHPFTNIRAIRNRFPYSSLDPLDSLMAAIERTQPAIIIPCDDTAVQHLHELHEHASRMEPALTTLTSLLEKSLGSPQGYPIVRSRHDLLRIAREEGLRVPKTSRLYKIDDLNAFCIQETHPLVLKADGTWGGNGVRIARTAQQAEAFFSELSRPSGLWEVLKRVLLNRDRFCLRQWCTGATPEIVAQEYISGRPANCAVFCWKGQVLAQIGVEVVSTRKSCGPASVVRVVNHPDMCLAAERIARRLQISGFFGLDFMLEASTGAAYLIEMNARCTRLSHLQLGKGRDMVAALYMQLTGQAQRERLPITHNELIAYFPEAWIDNSEFLARSFRDIPLSEPALVRELLKDSSDRTILGRLVDHLRKWRAAQRALKPKAPEFSLRSRAMSAEALQPEPRS